MNRAPVGDTGAVPSLEHSARRIGGQHPPHRRPCDGARHAARPSVVLFSPLSADPAFTREFAHPRVSFEILPAHAPDGFEGRLLGIIQARYLQICKTDTLRIRGRQSSRVRPGCRQLKRLLARVVAPDGRSVAAGTTCRIGWFRDQAMETAVRSYRPSLAAAASPGLIFSEIPVLRTARRRSIPSMAVDLSWDNLTNKFFPPRQVDRLVLWNSSMSGEALRTPRLRCRSHHRRGRAAVRLVLPRPTLNPRRVLRDEPASIRRAGSSRWRRFRRVSFPHHEFVIDRLIEAMAAGAVRHPADLLVRLHPRDDARRYENTRAART